MWEVIKKIDPLVAAAIVSAIVGLISGAVASLFAPWVNWGIEKKREREKLRRAKIGKWRNYVSQQDIFTGFVLTAVYNEMLPFFSEQLDDDIQKVSWVKAESYKHDLLKGELLELIARIERDVWKLI